MVSLLQVIMTITSNLKQLEMFKVLETYVEVEDSCMCEVCSSCDHHDCSP